MERSSSRCYLLTSSLSRTSCHLFFYVVASKVLVVNSAFWIVHDLLDQMCISHVARCFAAARWREVIAGEGFLGQLWTCVHFDLWGFGAHVLGLVLLRWNLLTVPAPGRGATAGGQDYQLEETERHSQAYNNGLWWEVEGLVSLTWMLRSWVDRVSKNTLILELWRMTVLGFKLYLGWMDGWTQNPIGGWINNIFLSG